MPELNINVAPVTFWELQLRGTDNIQFNGQAIQGAYEAMADCADVSGCMEDGQLAVNETCVETYERYLAPNGLGMRVRPTSAGEVTASKKASGRRQQEMWR
jgi:hypothetical protein